MTTETNQWFGKKWLLILLLFILPPIAIYGVFKRDSKIWKKIVFTLAGLVTSFFLLGYTLGKIFPTDHYKIGNSYFDKGEFAEAINNYERVEDSNEKYSLAQKRIKKASFKIDSIETSVKVLAEKRKLDSLTKIKTIKTFNVDYAERVLKEWNNTYVKSYNISKNNDSIIFNMSAPSTEGNWTSGAKLNERIYQKRYDSVFKSKFTTDNVTTKIVYNPNKGQLEKNAVIERRNHLVNRQFATFNGSNAFLVNFIKKRMNDPKSFEHINTSYKDKGSYIDVYMKFRGINAQGVLVLNQIKAKMSINGEVISVKYL